MNNTVKTSPTGKSTKENLPSVNERIRAERVQVIDQEGKNLGVVSKKEALQFASDAGLDLVLLSEGGAEAVAVAKIMDFGKSLYEKKKKQHESKKHQKVIQIKEVKLRPKIGEHDYDTKIKQIVQFLEDGKRVKVTLFFKGRERQLKDEQGDKFFDRVDARLHELGLGKNLVKEKEVGEAKQGSIISRIYYLKGK